VGRRLDNDDLASVQSRSWAAITGLRSELIGDEICSLSAAHDERFEMGCRNALAFFQALQSEAVPIFIPMMLRIESNKPEPRFGHDISIHT
jgi:hypothetical protein